MSKEEANKQQSGKNSQGKGSTFLNTLAATALTAANSKSNTASSLNQTGLGLRSNKKQQSYDVSMSNTTVKSKD